MTVTRYQSPSTPETMHDLPNLIVEALLINRHGAIGEASWRKGGAFSKEWGQLLTKVKRVGKLGVSMQQLAWFVKFYKITDLDYKEFGLLRWKIKAYFKWCDINQFALYYVALQSSLTKTDSSYIDSTSGYKVKEASSNKRKTLSDILRELESEAV